MSDPIAAMIAHIKEFLEKPHPAFNNMPPCPFVKKAREEDKLMFKCLNLTESTATVEEFLKTNYEAIVLIYPLETTEEEIIDTRDMLIKLFPDLAFFEGHPQNQFKVKDLYTRREPYPNIVAQYAVELNIKQTQLNKTKYYEHYTSSSHHETPSTEPSTPKT